MCFTAVVCDGHAGRTASVECRTIKATAHVEEAIDCNKIYISNKVSSNSYTLMNIIFCLILGMHESKDEKLQIRMLSSVQLINSGQIKEDVTCY